MRAFGSLRIARGYTYLSFPFVYVYALKNHISTRELLFVSILKAIISAFLILPIVLLAFTLE